MLTKRASRRHPSTTPGPTRPVTSSSIRDPTPLLDINDSGSLETETQASQLSQASIVRRGKQNGATNWHKDAKHPDDPSSYDLLVQWLCQGSNFADFKWCSNNSTAQEKSAECATWLEAHSCPTRRTPLACSNKMLRIYQAWKEAKDWLDGTGTGQGQRRLDEATAENREGVTLEIEAELERMCPHFREINACLLDKDGGNHNLRADSTTGNNPGHDTLVRSLSGLLEDDVFEDDPLRPADSETIYSLTQAASSFETLSPAPSQRGPTTPSLHTVSQRIGASGTASSSRRPNIGASHIDAHASAYMESQITYHEQTINHNKRLLEIQQEELKLSRKKARGDKFSRVWDAAKVLMERDSTLAPDRAFQLAMESWKYMEGVDGDKDDAENDVDEGL